jgi:hypothetical protein
VGLSPPFSSASNERGQLKKETHPGVRFGSSVSLFLNIDAGNARTDGSARLSDK